MIPGGKSAVYEEKVMKALVLTLALLIFLSGGCADDSGYNTARIPPDLDYEYYVEKVQPIMETRCAFYACHGSQERSFQIYQEARMRQNPEAGLIEATLPLTDSELERNFRQAAGLIFGHRDRENSLLFSKPLESGTRHGGATLFGGPDVFLSREDPDYQTLLQWANGARLEE